MRACWLAALMLLAAGPLIAAPVAAMFANGVGDARSIQPLRLFVDLGGRERQVRLELELPAGARLVPALRELTAGGAPSVQLLNVYVPRGTVAGAFLLRGYLVDTYRRWPFEAVMRVRANPLLLVMDGDLGFATVRAEETVRRSWLVTNSGNVLLQIRCAALPSTGVSLTAEPHSFSLAPGEHRELVLTARLDAIPNRLVTVPLFLNVDSGHAGFQRRETVGFTAEFIPPESGTGPLFAELSAEVLGGAVFMKGYHAFASRMRLEGELAPGVNLLAYGTDGTPAPGGSHLGLAARDFMTVDVGGKTWRATGGLVNPPSFGFLESSTQGRGGTLAWSDDVGLSLTALATRDHFGDFTREHLGLHLSQTDPDKTGWETGVLAQRNQSGPEPMQERWGAYAQANWRWSGLTGSSQVAVAEDAATETPRFGLEQRLDYRSQDDRSSAAVFVQAAPEGFFLDGRSVELRDASVGIGVQDTSRINLHWSESRQEGLLRAMIQAETEAGRAPTDPEYVELISRTGSKVSTKSAGFEFSMGESRAQLAYSDTRRTRESSSPTEVGESYRERAFTEDWSRGFRQGQLLVTQTLSAGTEENLSQSADFAEAAFTLGGVVLENLQFSTELRHSWHTGGARNAGYRQPGSYGRTSLIWTPRPRWRVELGVDAYQFSRSATRVRSYAVIEAPLTRRVALVTELSHDGEHLSLWLAARVNFRAPLPWRPVRGALAGRVRESGGGAPVPGARLDLDGRAGLTDADGRFTLPGRRPGAYPLTWSLPPQYLATSDWPRTVTLRAGELQTIDLAVQRIATLGGTVEIHRGGEIDRPTGSISATDESGRIFEAVAAAGDFKLLLPTGHYIVRYTGEISSELASQLTAKVDVGSGGETVSVLLTAKEEQRGVRRTFFKDDEARPPTPVAP